MDDLYERLLAEVASLEGAIPQPGGTCEALAAVLEVHKPIPAEVWDAGAFRATQQCKECAGRCHSGSGLSCDQPIDAEYPCSTVRAVARALDVRLAAEMLDVHEHEIERLGTPEADR